MIYDDGRALHDPSVRQSFERALERSSAGLATLRGWYEDARLPLLRLPEARDDLAQVQDLASDIAAGFADFIVLGTGGSNLGAKTLFALIHQGLGQSSSPPHCHFFDNVDPVPFRALMARLDPTRTFILCVSKSGTTAETLSQSVLLIDWLQRAGCPIDRHLAVLSEPKPSPLTDLARRFGCRQIAHDRHIGGRFSVLSVVGLLPALVAGVDAHEVRAGARAALQPVLDAWEADRVPAARGAALAVAQAAAGKTQSVLLPYADQLADFGLWYRQLWAESLGKEGLGTTPIRALGTVDQHSQLQLYLDGPADKLFSFIEVAQADVLPPLNADLLDDQLAYLRHRSLSDLLVAECRASADTLVAKGHPVRTMQIEAVTAFTLGHLMMHFMLETMLTAQLWGIDAFDQPAVEAIKERTREVLAG